MTLALEGLKILDLSRYAPGPFCTMILGDLGADIIKIEEVGSPTGRRVEKIKGLDPTVVAKEFASQESPYNPLNRNKRSLCLNLKTPAGREIFYRLVESADVVVEGFRPGVTRRLGIDYPTLKAKNPRLIYCAVTGYGQDGPYCSLPGHDINYVALSGAIAAMSLPGKPHTLPGNLVGDIAGGSLQAAIGILAALAAREKTGRGQMVDISITDGVIGLLSLYLSGYYEQGALPQKEDRVTCGAAPYYNIFQTGDGRYISLGSSEPWFFANLCRILGCEEFIPYQNDSRKAVEIKSYFAKKFLTRRQEEWFELLSQADVPVGKVLSLDEVADDPQVKHRRMVIEVDAGEEGKVKQGGIAIKLSETPGRVRNIGAVHPGENTSQILAELGYSQEEIQNLKRENCVA
jgi:alpha-methylacyl-CoA racemase